MEKKRYIIIAVVLILAATVGLVFYCNSDKLDALGLVFPPEKEFVDAPFADACEALNITLAYDDSQPLISVEDSLYRRIRFSLVVTPREGVEVKDFYCTIVLNEWIEEHAGIRTPHMGMSKTWLWICHPKPKGLNPDGIE